MSKKKNVEEKDDKSYKNSNIEMLLNYKKVATYCLKIYKTK